MSDLGNKLAQQFIDKFDELRQKDGDNITIGDIDGLFKYVRSERRNEIYDGIDKIAKKIEKIKIEMQGPHAGQTKEEKFLDANLELEAVISAAEDATNTILDSTEIIQSAVMEFELSDEQNARIFDEITKIFEACNFQDITGQRISNVVHTLMEIDQSITELFTAIHGKVEFEVKKSEAKAQSDTPSDEDLMNGPQLDVPTQDEIDKLFAES